MSRKTLSRPGLFSKTTHRRQVVPLSLTPPPSFEPSVGSHTSWHDAVSRLSRGKGRACGCPRVPICAKPGENCFVIYPVVEGQPILGPGGGRRGSPLFRGRPPPNRFKNADRLTTRSIHADRTVGAVHSPHCGRTLRPQVPLWSAC